ncbi:hypothetical protein UFOVP112_126 [uncultured Caudovirales phage]|uniref:Uncharacterized protein n=1 Tax=uncultured Caudovirales phage TaxID=2100421 RepID=A0A6J5L6U5_9CAUD|nr:hypothetical protein UFOVP112_126 [uncultured Caudovirales phage]
MSILPNQPLPGTNAGDSVGAQFGTAVRSSLTGTVGLSSRSTYNNLADEMYSRSQQPAGPMPIQFNPLTSAPADWRVRVSLAPGSKYFYNDPRNTLLSPLVKETGTGTSAVGNILGNLAGGWLGTNNRIGVVFPYTPTMQITHMANYTPQKLTHSNYAQYFYDSSEVQAINITAEFTVQNVNEGQYLLACLYFFRSVTKMFFGADQDPAAGNPPPLVYLNGYGQYYLPNVPCVVTQFSHTMPPDCDYMDIPEPAVTNTGYNPQTTNYRLNSTRLPTTSSISLMLQPVYSRLAQSTTFSLSQFAAGQLINQPSSATAFGRTTSGANGGFL